LYKLCDKITLDRIEPEGYLPHLNRLAKLKWKSTLTEKSLTTLFTCTDLHPYYMNLLCAKLWNEKSIPSAEKVQQTWHILVREERLEVIRELMSLSQGQRKLLLAIAQGDNQAPTAKAFLKKINMSSSAVVEALKILQEKDYIEQRDDKKYYLIDPMINTLLQLYFDSPH